MENNLQSIKQRFGIIGNSPLLNRAIEIACQVAPVDITVLIQGESGVGKEVFPKIIHSLSARKFNPYIAVNCGAIPEGTIESELFGHEKGAFTGATEARKGYFEAANGGTIFLDEVAELPMTTQVRLLRVLETGEFIKVGSSKVQKTDVRVVAATNDDFNVSIKKGKFRQDLYYRLSTVPIFIPPLRERQSDIYLLFRKFTSTFAENNRMPVITLNDEAREMLENYKWEGNVRQLKNIAEQISIIEKDRVITPEILSNYLHETHVSSLPVLVSSSANEKTETSSNFTEREILYKILFDMRNDISELRATLNHIMKADPISDVSNVGHINGAAPVVASDDLIINNMNKGNSYAVEPSVTSVPAITSNMPSIQPIHEINDSPIISHPEPIIQNVEVLDETLSLVETEIRLIKRALSKHNGRRKNAADELGISERTLYRKIKEYDIE